MRTFQEFMSLCEASNGDAASQLGWGGGVSITKTGAGGKIGKERKKTAPEIRRVKAVGGGKTEPVQYKPRKDIGSRRQASTRVQQPEQERGSARERQLAAAKEERRKAAQARAAAKKGGGEESAAEKPKAKEVTKTASQLLAKKKKQTVSPDYKPAKASGYSHQERQKVTKSGERMLRGIMKDQETAKYREATGENPKGKAKTKILGHVEKRMST